MSAIRFKHAEPQLCWRDQVHQRLLQSAYKMQNQLA